MDFSKLKQKKKSYGGANGNKLSIVIDDELYMLKLPSHAKNNKNISYSNSSISEYLGSHIYNLLGIDAQETILGTFNYKGKQKIAVACKDFEKNGYVLKDFASVKNQIVDSESNGYGTELSDILETIEKQQIIDPIELSNYFWNMFVIDAILGNWDRHNGNWGFLYNQESDDIKLAPVFDCGSCLFPQIDESIIKKVFENKKEMDIRIYDMPTSAILIDGIRINYYEFIKSHKYKQCDEAIKRIVNVMDLEKIGGIIDEIEYISDIYKKFLKTMIKERYEKIVLQKK